MKLTRAKLEQLIGDLLESSIGPVERALADAKLKPKDIDEVILVGGSTRIPMVQKLLRDYFGKEPNKSVNPDEAVSIGAAIQGAVLSGQTKDILLLDVTPLTLGVETLGGVMTPLIKRNTTIPTSKKEIFSTAADSQTSVDIHILQGERPMAADNRTLGRFILDGIPPAPRGIPQIEVAFDIDANGILNVSAKDLATGKQQSIIIKSSTGLSDSEVERMVKDAEKFAEQDKKHRELIETRNHADSLIYTCEKTVREYGDKVGAGEKSKVESAINKLKSLKDTENIDEIKRAMDELSRASQEFSKILYEEAAKKQGASGAGGTSTPPRDEKPKEKKGPDDGVIDAEFETK
jgi:molecular chaperone DnaK